MRVIILAAGQGTRLRPLTDDRPKCLVELGGVSLLERQARVLAGEGFRDLCVVGGYRADQIESRGFRVVRNPRYEQTNMVASLFCVAEAFDGGDDVLVAYGDIVYERRVLRAVAASPAAIALAVDLAWRRYWSVRFADPLSDAETMKLDAEGFVVELGKKPRSYDDIQGQYMGLFKIRADEAPRVREAWRQLDRTATYDGKSFDNMYMTSFLQHLIDTGHAVTAVPVRGGWLETDSLADLRTYHEMQSRGELAAFCDLEAAGQ